MIQKGGFSSHANVLSFGTQPLYSRQQDGTIRGLAMSRASTSADRLWTIPNAVTLVRFGGIPALLLAAYGGRRSLFLFMVIALFLTDWLDGKLASILHQRTTLGARLDSAVDALFYMSIALSFWWLERAVIESHLIWFWGVLISWLVSCAVSLVRFRRLPSYHMWSAKIAWFVSAWTVILLLVTEISFTLPIALGLAVFSNAHAVAITLTLPRWSADVWSLRRAWRIRRGRDHGKQENRIRR